MALEASGCGKATVMHKPRLLSDNGSFFVVGDLANFLEDRGKDPVRGAPHHPQPQGKIPLGTVRRSALPGSGTLAPDPEEPGLPENYSLRGDLERQTSAIVDHHKNNRRCHESLGNLASADVYHGRGAKILKMREEIKKRTT